MSYYIEFKTKPLKLRSDTPIDVIAFLDALINNDNWDVELPAHNLFSLKRWSSLFSKNDYNKTAFVKHNEQWILTISCEINYGIDEIDEFAKWIAPYVAGHKPKEFIGTSRGEGLRAADNVYIIRDKLKQ